MSRRRSRIVCDSDSCRRVPIVENEPVVVLHPVPVKRVPRRIVPTAVIEDEPVIALPPVSIPAPPVLPVKKVPRRIVPTAVIEDIPMAPAFSVPIAPISMAPKLIPERDLLELQTRLLGAGLVYKIQSGKATREDFEDRVAFLRNRDPGADWTVDSLIEATGVKVSIDQDQRLKDTINRWERLALLEAKEIEEYGEDVYRKMAKKALRKKRAKSKSRSPKKKSKSRSKAKSRSKSKPKSPKRKSPKKKSPKKKSPKKRKSPKRRGRKPLPSVGVNDMVLGDCLTYKVADIRAYAKHRKVPLTKLTRKAQFCDKLQSILASERPLRFL